MKTIKVVIILLTIIGTMACTQKANKSKIETSSQSDLQTDTLENGSVGAESRGQVIKEILEKSPRYCQLTKGLLKAVVKNGGTSFGISFEGSPNPKADSAMSISRTYDFTLYESYPERRLTTHSFSFDPRTRKLYEYDDELAQKRTLEIDNELLHKYELLCQ